MYLYIHVLHKINNADKLTDNVLSLIRICFIILSQIWTLFICSFITICDYLDRCRFQTLRGKVNEACPFGYRCTRFWTPDLTFGQKKGENTSLNFQCVVLTNPFFFIIYLFFNNKTATSTDRSSIGLWDMVKFGYNYSRQRERTRIRQQNRY